MNTVNATHHARKRMQQRAVNELQVRLIQEFGRYEYQKGGEYIAQIPEKTLAELRQALDKLHKLVIVTGESGCVVTTMHQQKRIRTTNYVA